MPTQLHDHPQINHALHTFLDTLSGAASKAWRDIEHVAQQEGIELADNAAQSLAKVGGVALEHLAGGAATVARVAQEAADAGVAANIPGGAFLDIGALFPDIVKGVGSVVSDIFK